MRSRPPERPEPCSPLARSGRATAFAGAALAAVLVFGGFAACRQVPAAPEASSRATASVEAASVVAAAGVPLTSPAAFRDDLVDWVERVPARASAWLAGRPAAPELDSARAALAVHPDVLVPRPDFAAAQAALITDADVRRATLAEVYSTWARLDPVAARRHASAEPSLDLIERTHLDELLASVEPIR